jgi:hypothetical protein
MLHMELEPEPVTASEAWQSMQSEAMDCHASLAMTASLWSVQHLAVTLFIT